MTTILGDKFGYDRPEASDGLRKVYVTHNIHHTQRAATPRHAKLSHPAKGVTRYGGPALGWVSGTRKMESKLS